MLPSHSLYHYCTSPPPFPPPPAQVTITRSEDCQAVSIVCVPQREGVGAVDSGPVTLSLYDRELQVLLINQRGLYTLAQSKWSALEMVAQWLSSRLRVRAVRVLGAGDPVPVVETAAMREAAKRKKFIEDGGSPGLVAGGGASSLFSPIKAAPASLAKEAQDRRDQAVASSLGDFADLAPAGRKPVMLDVYVDRDVEVAKEALRQWRSRNVPAIPDMTVSLSARQDLDLLRFEVALTFPPPKLRRLRNAQAADGLVDYNALNDGDSSHADDSVPVVVTLNFRLTCSELLTFGTAEPLEGIKLSMNAKTSGDNHPSAFMWNVLLRMTLIFAGSTSAPFSKHCRADDKENWELRFDRRLLRDIRSISGGVVMVVASCVGDELVYECEPTEGSAYAAVGSKVMSAEDLQEMIYSEGWPLALLAFPARAQLAFRVLEKLKIVAEQGSHRLEVYNFPESRMIGVSQQGVNGRADVPLGVVEISDHFTLGDLRVVIRHELDKEVVPRLYRFFYKGGPCAVRQEPFRRAWDCLPVCVLIPRINKPDPKDAKVRADALFPPPRPPLPSFFSRLPSSRSDL